MMKSQYYELRSVEQVINHSVHSPVGDAPPLLHPHKSLLHDLTLSFMFSRMFINVGDVLVPF